MVWRGDNYNENMLMMTTTRARASRYLVSYKEWRERFLYLKTFLFFWFMSGMKFPAKIQYVFQCRSIFKSAQNIDVSVSD